MAAEARRKCLLHQVHLTLATRVWAGPKPITSSTLPEWSQNKAAFGFTIPPPSPQHHIPPPLCATHLSLLASLKLIQYSTEAGLTH